MLLVNTFDIEPWWTTLPPCVDLDHWDEMPDRSEAPLHAYLDLCDEAGVKSTFFAVGWYAKRFPKRIEELVRRGHEVGCHSLHHDDVATLSLERFVASTREAKAIIEDAAGADVIAYRAPSFSLLTERVGEFFAELSAMGFAIDSSVCTAVRIHGGGFDKNIFSSPSMLKDLYGIDLFEVPVPGVTIAGRSLQLFGGGYMRLAPITLLDYMATRVDYQVLYLHCHDFDTGIPWLPDSSIWANFRRRIKVGNLRSKVLDLFATSHVRSCGQLLADYRACPTAQ